MTTAESAASDELGPIIVVDDSVDDFHVVERMYRRSKLENPLLYHESGDQVLTFLNEYELTVAPPIRLILMDINMPGLDGIQVVSRIRQMPPFVEVPIISMLTSSSDPFDRDRSVAAGADDYLIKPMDPTEYIAFFNQLADAEDAA